MNDNLDADAAQQNHFESKSNPDKLTKIDKLSFADEQNSSAAEVCK